MTLQDLKSHPSLCLDNDIDVLWQKRLRFQDLDFESIIEPLIYTNDGRQLKSDKDIELCAAMLYNTGIFTDEEWKNTLLPIINNKIAAV